MTTPRTSLWLIGSCALLLAVSMARPERAFAVGEQVGRIRGIVTNPATKQPLDGVTITATGPALIGPPRAVFSNASGRYEILDLPPGTYRVSFSYPGTVASTH